MQGIESLKNETGKEAYFIELDLADLASVKKAAAEFLSKEPQLHVLFNNAYVPARLHRRCSGLTPPHAPAASCGSP